MKNSISSKKAEGLSLTVVVIAVLVLLVLIVLILVFTGRIGLFQQGVDSCDKSDEGLGTSCAEGAMTVKVVKDKAGKIKYCCRWLPGSEGNGNAYVNELKTYDAIYVDKNAEINRVA